MRHARKKKTKKLHYPTYKYKKKSLLYHVTCPDCIWRGLALDKEAAGAVALSHYWEKTYGKDQESLR